MKKLIFVFLCLMLFGCDSVYVERYKINDIKKETKLVASLGTSSYEVYSFWINIEDRMINVSVGINKCLLYKSGKYYSYVEQYKPFGEKSDNYNFNHWKIYLTDGLLNQLMTVNDTQEFIASGTNK